MKKFQPERKFRKCTEYFCIGGKWVAKLECGHWAPFKPKTPEYRPSKLICHACIEYQLIVHKGLVGFAENQVRRYGIDG